MEVSLRVPLLAVRLRFSFWFFAVAALFLLMDRQVVLWYVALPVVIHEAGHLLAMLLCGMRVAELRFTPVSVRIMTASPRSLSYGRELFVAAGGILANLLAALGLHLFAFSSMRNMMMTASNLAVAAFNLLPVSTLDGGRMIRLFARQTGGLSFARGLCAAASVVVLVPLTAAAVLLALRGTVNFTAPALCLYLIAAVLLHEE